MITIGIWRYNVLKIKWQQACIIVLLFAWSRHYRNDSQRTSPK